MINIFNRLKIFGRLFLASVIFSSFIFTNAAYGQETYFTYVQWPSIMKKVETLRNEGKSDDDIVQFFIKNKIFKKITPDLAKEEFKGLKWLYDEDDTKGGPALLVCPMGKAGYGLFALTNFVKDSKIVEYKGKKTIFNKHVNRDGIQENDYTVMLYSKNGVSVGIIDAKEEGNAARFSQHQPTKGALEQFGYKFNKGYVAASPNADLLTIDIEDPRTYLHAIKSVNVFDQICFSYHYLFGFEHTKWNVDEVCIFSEKGEIIPRDEYEILNTAICYIDGKSNEVVRIDFIDPKEVVSIKEFQYDPSIQLFGLSHPTDNKKCITFNAKEWINKFKTSNKNRVTSKCNVMDISEAEKLENIRAAIVETMPIVDNELL